MSGNILKKSYSVVATRSTGQQVELETVGEYPAAVKAAKDALTGRGTTEVRIVENRYNEETRKDHKQVVKILNQHNAGHVQGNAIPGRPDPHRNGISHAQATRASSGITNLVIALIVLVVLVGVMVPMIIN
jgi:hypothetical protein